MADETYEDYKEIDLDAGDIETESSNNQKKNKPEFRVVQTEVDQNGNTRYKSVGAMWKQVSKNGNEFYVLKIGNLRLLVFKNNR